MDKMSDIHGYRIGYDRISMETKDKISGYAWIRSKIYMDTE
jgi:hypothetical protein